MRARCCIRRAISIAEDETTGSLKRKLAELGAEALLEALEKATAR